MWKKRCSKDGNVYMLWVYRHDVDGTAQYDINMGTQRFATSVAPQRMIDIVGVFTEDK